MPTCLVAVLLVRLDLAVLLPDYSESNPPLGCVVAGRLAYADPNLQVMLVEGRHR